MKKKSQFDVYSALLSFLSRVTIGGTATKDVDYVILTDSSNVYLKSSGVLAVIFSTSDTEKVIKFFIINDQDVESSTWKETIVLNITDDAAYNTTGAHKTQKINIADDDGKKKKNKCCQVSKYPILGKSWQVKFS